MSEEKKDYSKGFVGDILDAGASRRLNPKNDDLKEMRELLATTEGNVLRGSGVSEEETQAYVSGQMDAIQSDYEDNKGAISRMSTTNTIINGLSFVPAISKGVGAAKSRLGIVSKSTALTVAGEGAFKTAGNMMRSGTECIKNGHVLQGIGQYTKAGTTLLGRGLSKAGHGIDKVDDILGGEKGIGTKMMKMAGTGKDFMKHPLLGTALKTTGFAVKHATSIAPVVAAQIYTRGRVDKMDKDLSDAITLVVDRTDYLNAEGPKLTGEAGEAYGQWHENYTASMGELTRQLEAGEITQAQFDEMYEAESRSQAEALEELDSTYPEMARKMVSEGEAYRMAETGAKIGADIDGVGRYDSSAKKLMEENPDAKALYTEKKAEYEALDTGSSFTNFIASMHAALVHYLPGFAYLEAGVIKAADVALGFVANKVPVVSDIVNYDEHYKGQTLTSMASRIVDTAEARYEQQTDADGTTQALQAGQKSWQEQADDVRGDMEAGPAPA